MFNFLGSGHYLASCRECWWPFDYLNFGLVPVSQKNPHSFSWFTAKSVLFPGLVGFEYLPTVKAFLISYEAEAQNRLQELRSHDWSNYTAWVSSVRRSTSPHGLIVTVQTGLITSLVATLDLIFFLYDVSFWIPLSGLLWPETWQPAGTWALSPPPLFLTDWENSLKAILSSIFHFASSTRILWWVAWTRGLAGEIGRASCRERV